MVHGFVARCKNSPFSIFVFCVYVISIGTKIRKILICIGFFWDNFIKNVHFSKNMMIVKMAIHIVRSYEFTISFIFFDLRSRKNCDFGGSCRICVVNRKSRENSDFCDAKQSRHTSQRRRSRLSTAPCGCTSRGGVLCGDTFRSQRRLMRRHLPLSHILHLPLPQPLYNH